jgi:hypothetical protein
MNLLYSAAFALVLCWVGPTLLDGPSEQQATQDIDAMVNDIAKQSVDMYDRIERAAAAACIRQAGPGATHAWTDKNTLVCTPSTITTGAL